MKNTIIAISLFLSTQIILAADVPAPGYRDIASGEISDITVLISKDNGYSPAISFRTGSERFVFTPSTFAGLNSNSSTVAAAAAFVELLREANYISIRSTPTDRRDSTDLPIIEITDVGFHYKK